MMIFKSPVQLSVLIISIVYRPCTVAFAPIAVKAPKVPTMKYEKTLFVVSPPFAMYLPKLGILVVGLASAPRKGLSNDEVR